MPAAQPKERQSSAQRNGRPSSARGSRAAPPGRLKLTRSSSDVLDCRRSRLLDEQDPHAQLATQSSNPFAVEEKSKNENEI